MFWFCIILVFEVVLGINCNEIVDLLNCVENENCINSICVCSDGYFNVIGKCELSKF